jgi:hypothetical protein
MHSKSETICLIAAQAAAVQLHNSNWTGKTSQKGRNTRENYSSGSFQNNVGNWLELT